MKERPRVVILGGGISGIKAAQQLANQPVDVLIIDHNNYQVFQPLLYQVATSMLSTDEVVYPIRGFFKKANNVDFLLAEVRGIQPEAKIVKTSHGDVPYDYLIIALGSTPNFFGNKEVERNAFPLKTLQDAIRIRSHLLSVFEEASAETDPEKRKALLTFVFVGAGPIGVEGAGGVSELVYDVLQKEFHHIDFEEVSIHLIGADPCVLSMMSEKLRIETLKVLQKKRIDVQCSMLVTGYDGETLSYRPMNAPKDAPCSTLKAKTVVWSAGVRPVDCLNSFACEKDRGKRLLIDDTIRVPGMQDVFAIGDCSSYTPPGEQRPLPTLAPVALAEGELAAKNILHDVRGEEMEHLHYKSKGVMAIIGNSEAVMEAGPLRGRGFLAWSAWLWIHLLTKAGFHANITVTFKWIFNYLSGTRLGRLITRPELKGLPESIKNAPGARDAGVEKQAS
ncbi:NAD(P)/FAD-dependent oxidoreductase [Mitsuokella multacida]|uniref:NAD(P)/FAD-dependent oxidoreductase n=1 Tax=Mitsuokella multacida TaxID=52226 RepID=UPI001F423A13|nr:NAD(P)/FAD-dependent oxidoreductase [Mitsuokella multacida]MCF2584310.1 NAD(P)/FAD-dependent oxidoreductase [Mitsuokella multacida]